jgi:hypothetical protein
MFHDVGLLERRRSQDERFEIDGFCPMFCVRSG